MSSSSADEIIKKCHDVGEKLQAESKNVNTAGHHHTNTNTTSNHPVHYLHELPLAAEKRYETLFSQLDRNGMKSILFCVCDKEIKIGSGMNIYILFFIFQLIY